MALQVALNLILNSTGNLEYFWSLWKNVHYDLRQIGEIIYAFDILTGDNLWLDQLINNGTKLQDDLSFQENRNHNYRYVSEFAVRGKNEVDTTTVVVRPIKYRTIRKQRQATMKRERTKCFTNLNLPLHRDCRSNQRQMLKSRKSDWKLGRKLVDEDLLPQPAW